MRLRLTKILTHWPQITIGFLMVVYAGVLSYFSILRHDAFASGFDLGNMDQTIWNTLHGRWFELSGEVGRISRFAIHADIVLVLLSPLYLIWNDVRVLLVAQSMIIASGAIPVYLLARHFLNRRDLSVAFVVIYLFNTGLQWTNLYDFHPVVIAQVALFWAVYCGLKAHWRRFALSVIIALMCKETVGLSVFVMGCLMFICMRDKRAGALTAFVGFVWFVAMTFIVMKHFSTQNAHWALSWYTANEETVPEVFTLRNIFFRIVQSPEAHKYYELLLKPFGFIPLLGLPWSLVAIVEILINVMSNHGQMRSINLHYDALILPWFLIGAMVGVRLVGHIVAMYRARIAEVVKYLLVGSILTMTLHTYYFYGPLPITPACWCYVYEVTEEDRAFERALQAIPQNAVVSASGEIRPHITHREHAYTIPSATESAEFIAIINQNRAIGNYEQKDYETSLIADLKNKGDHELIAAYSHLFLFQRKPVIAQPTP